MTRRTRIAVALAVGIAAVLAGLNWVSRRKEYRTVAEVRAQLVVAGVVPGAPVSRVLRVLDSLGAQHSAVDSAGVVSARIGLSFEDLFIHGDIFVAFRFDSSGHLVSQTVRERLTGP